MGEEILSVFDIFKIGIGPSSSHTLGPWRAAEQFCQTLENARYLEHISSVKILLYGSLAKTGKGHGTDIAILLGLSGHDPVTFDTQKVNEEVEQIKSTGSLSLSGKKAVSFNFKEDLLFLMDQSLDFHPNAVTFQAFDASDFLIAEETYYSIGGGFVVKEGEEMAHHQLKLSPPYPISKAAELQRYCTDTGLSISEIVLQNELTWASKAEIEAQLRAIYQVFTSSIYKGCHSSGTLPGGLNVSRRAAGINKKLLGSENYHSFQEWKELICQSNKDFRNILAWVSCFALAVNEENASFGRVVTAPTNGAAGVIPAVLLYYVIFCDGDKEDDIFKFLFTAAEIGSIFKKGATISAAMGGCQAEIGVSSAMAAAALTECLGGTPQQALMAAEIAMEHHLGLTCDPIGGLVQIPCIERNTMGAIKAITAAQLALESEPENAKVSLDAVVNTMWQTALDMNSKYKETADGGLAIQIPISLPDC